MKRIFSRSIAPALLAALALVFSAGCAKEKPAAENANPEEELYSPVKVAELYLASYQFGQVESVAGYFSKELPADIVNKYISDFSKKYEVGRYKTKQLSADDTTAAVKVVYTYNEKGQIRPVGTKPKYFDVTLKLVRENKVWKLRNTGSPATDKKIEENIFLKCLNTIMDITVAQEKVRSVKDSYSSSLAELMRVVPFDEFACNELSVSDADENGFNVVATTKNLVPCEIKGNTDEHFPMEYDECELMKLPKLPAPAAKTPPPSEKITIDVVKETAEGEPAATEEHPAAHAESH